MRGNAHRATWSTRSAAALCPALHMVANAFGYLAYFDTSSNNSAMVTGAGSLWTNSGNLNVGFEGSGNSLEISHGANVANDGIGFIGYLDTSSNNSVLVTGTSSLWTHSGGLFVGYSGSSNRLIVTNGGIVANTDGYIGCSAPRELLDEVLSVVDASLFPESK